MSDLNQLLTTILTSPKYRHISPDLVRRIGERELANRKKFKDAVKATKNKLHQVGSAYFEKPIDYERALNDLQASDDFRATARDIMTLHASTRERLPILDNFYSTILADLPPIQTVLDVACGLNPLTWPWLPNAEILTFTACDIYGDMIDFINQAMPLANISVQAELRDVISNPPTQPIDLALVLKALPCLEQAEKTAVSHLLDSLNARHLLISYPLQSLGGRRKGMADSYTAHFQTLAAERNWQYKTFTFPTELAFLVHQIDN